MLMLSDVHVPKPEPIDSCVQWGDQPYDVQPPGSVLLPSGHAAHYTPLHPHPALDHTLYSPGARGGGPGGVHYGGGLHDGEPRVWQQLR